nr:hypothetical protein [Tanacetum cinerariifolium]
MYYQFRDAFHRLFKADERTFKSVLSRNIQNLERQLNKETLHKKDFNSNILVIKVQFDQFIHSKVLEPSNYNSYDLETVLDFKEYTQIEPQTFTDVIIQNMDSIEQCIVEIKSHEQELQNGLKRLNEKSCRFKKVQEIKASDASSGDKDCSRIVSDKGNDQVKKVDSNVIPNSSDMCDNDIQTDQNVEDERDALSNLIANLKLDIDENKMIQKQLKKANASLTQELQECKSTLAETSRTLWESNSIRDSCLIALQYKHEFERYKAFNDRTVSYDELELVKEKHDELVKQSLLTKSHYEELIEKMKGKSVDTNFKKQLILGKPPLKPIRNQPVVRQPTAYKFERSQLPRHRIASQVGVSHDLTKPVTPHTWPQVRKSYFAKPYDANAPGSSWNCPKHVSFLSPRESVGSNDMVHNYYLA